jgi:hypothetical protein
MYTYITSKEFITNLEFTYAETYSFQRGEVYENTNKSFKEEYERLTRRNEKRNNLTNEEKERLSFLKESCGFTQYLVNSEGEFHYSAQKTNTFQANSIEIQEVKIILKMPIQEKISLMCAPFYRDAIVFYDKNNSILEVLNVCLSCLHLETKPFAHINADFRTYDALKRFFINIGHDVEKPDYSFEDDIKKMQEKAITRLSKKSDL